ncbi:MAG: hypothetical protein ABJA77_01760 [Variovorax sp.]
MRATGGSGQDVVRVRMYVVGLDGQKHRPVINAAMRQHFGDRGPTSTLVGVQALAARASYSRSTPRPQLGGR